MTLESQNNNTESYIVSNDSTLIGAQVRIAEAENTAKYWTNLGSQESVIVIGPVSPFASVECWADVGSLCRLFEFTDLQPKLGPVSALYQDDCHFYYGIQFHVSLLPRQTILVVRKAEFGTASAQRCAENKCWRLEFGPELSVKCWVSVGPYLTSYSGVLTSDLYF